MSKSLQREIVEDTVGHWPNSGCPTDGYLRSALEAIGFAVRGKAMKREALMRLANENGLDFVEATAEKDDDNRR